MLARREVTNTYREKLKNIDAVKDGLNDLINRLDDNKDDPMQQSYDDIINDIDKQKDKLHNLAIDYDDQVQALQKASNDAQKLLNELDKKKLDDKPKQSGNEPEYKLVDEVVNEWEEDIVIPIPKLDIPDLPEMRDVIKIKRFEKVPVNIVDINETMVSAIEMTEDEDELKLIDDPSELIFSDDEETAPDEKIEDLIKEEKILEEQLKKESMVKLFNEPITDPEAKKILGDPTKYDLPKDEAGKKKLEKDFKEISKSLKDIADEKMRKYAKLTVLKEYTKIYDTYRRYCHAGGDLDWLNRAGWNAFIYDADIAEKEDGDCDKKKCGKLHRIVYNYYHKTSKQRAKREREKRLLELQKQNPHWNDDDPWTGQWVQHHANDTKNAAKETYHIRQFGVKLVGFIKVPEFCEITGHIDEFAFLKGSYMLEWIHGARAGQRRLCEVHLEPPETGNEVKMIVDWKEIGPKAKNKGSYTMIKISKRTAVNEKNVKIDIGLARHEFFEATLRLSKMRKKYKDLEEYAALDGFTEEHILGMIWNMLFENPSGNKDIKKTIRSYSTPFHKLFNRYSASNKDKSASAELLGDDEWLSFTKHIVKYASKEFKIKGSAPNKVQVNSCFNWALKLNKYEFELEYKSFEKCLLNYAQAMFRKRKGSSYKPMGYINKFNLLCKIAQRVERKPVK